MLVKMFLIACLCITVHSGGHLALLGSHCLVCFWLSMYTVVTLLVAFPSLTELITLVLSLQSLAFGNAEALQQEGSTCDLIDQMEDCFDHPFESSILMPLMQSRRTRGASANVAWNMASGAMVSMCMARWSQVHRLRHLKRVPWMLAMYGFSFGQRIHEGPGLPLESWELSSLKL